MPGNSWYKEKRKKSHMNIKKTFICFEPGEKHSSLCILVKMSELVGRLNPTMKFLYTVHALETLPPGVNNLDTLELIKSRMKAYVIGDIRFIMGYDQRQL